VADRKSYSSLYTRELQNCVLEHAGYQRPAKIRSVFHRLDYSYTKSSKAEKCQLCSMYYNMLSSFFLLVSWGGVKLEFTCTAATAWPIIPATVERWWLWSNRWNENWQDKQKYLEKPSLVPLCPPQIPHDLTWAWTPAAAVGSRQLTAWATAQSLLSNSYHTWWNYWTNNNNNNNHKGFWPWCVNAQNHWVFGLSPPYTIIKNRKDKVSETGSVSVFRWRGRHLLCRVPFTWGRKSSFRNAVFSIF
jgi:hypothetical protein